MQQKITWKGTCREETVYLPQRDPGFAAWVTAFDYGDGTVGLSFDEIVREKTSDPAPLLEFGEAAGVPVSYCAVECRSNDTRRYRVYMKSEDGITFAETGRCPRETGSFCNVGFPDGRIIGYDVPKINEAGTGWADCICVRESTDGGKTWKPIRELLKGTAPYLWRVRRLKDGTVVLLASLYGTPWGKGCLRGTRNTMLPHETYIGKILTFFMTSRDGIHFSSPVYILPGIGAHEYDFAELNDGRLLFVAGDVQGTPVGRQIVQPSEDGYIVSPLLPIFEGAPADPAGNPQGGYVPETFCFDPERKFLLGCRRGKGFSVSVDLGENWFAFEIPEVKSFPYQPVMIGLPDGSYGLYGHQGGDNALGECEMLVRVLKLEPAWENLPVSAELTLNRNLASDGSHYENAYIARLTSNGTPLPGKTVSFRFNAFWNPDGSVNTTAQAEAPYTLSGMTDENGEAICRAERYDGIPDIHLAYNVDVVFEGDRETRPCAGPLCTVLALTPYRDCMYPYEAYMAEDRVYLSPDLLRDFPEAVERINEDPEELPAELSQRLEATGVLKVDGTGRCRWISNVHRGDRQVKASPMSQGDLYR